MDPDEQEAALMEQDIDALSEEEILNLWVAEMERRVKESQRGQGRGSFG